MLGGEMDVLGHQKQNVTAAFCKCKAFESNLSSGHLSAPGEQEPDRDGLWENSISNGAWFQFRKVE
jgi:hypothetical protein